jgi:hypothetical protein
MSAREDGRWKGLVCGILGGAAGLAAMRCYLDNVAPRLEEAMRGRADEGGQEQKERSEARSLDLEDPLVDMSVAGPQYEAGEKATSVVGRRIYRWSTGREPRAKESRQLLGNLVHWGYGLMQGGYYGACRSRAGWPDLRGGMLHGASLWLVGDEFIAPVLGLQPGPAAASGPEHLNRLGAHMAFSLTAAATTQLLRRIF